MRRYSREIVTAPASIARLIVFAIPFLAWGQVAEYANSGYKTPEARQRIAGTLTAHTREQTQQPKQLVAALDLKPGMTVADIGTGAGFMLPYLAEAVGAGGTVIAEDIFPDFLEQARKTAQAKSLSNVQFVLGTEKGVNLEPNSIDVALVLDAYHHFDYPAEMLASLHRALKPGGRLAIVDFYQKGFRDPKHIRLDEKEVIQEITKHGFRLVSSRPFQPDRQYIAILEKA
jgi:ubiquinone/menaquinone biosynthesis C-methylase UbiE